MGRSVFAQPATSRNTVAISAIARERIYTLPRPWLSIVLHHGLCAGSWPGSDREPRPVRADPRRGSALSTSVRECHLRMDEQAVRSGRDVTLLVIPPAPCRSHG